MNPRPPPFTVSIASDHSVVRAIQEALSSCSQRMGAPVCAPLPTLYRYFDRTAAMDNSTCPASRGAGLAPGSPVGSTRTAASSSSRRRRHVTHRSARKQPQLLISPDNRCSWRTRLFARRTHSGRRPHACRAADGQGRRRAAAQTSGRLNGRLTLGPVHVRFISGPTSRVPESPGALRQSYLARTSVRSQPSTDRGVEKSATVIPLATGGTTGESVYALPGERTLAGGADIFASSAVRSRRLALAASHSQRSQQNRRPSIDAGTPGDDSAGRTPAGGRAGPATRPHTRNNTSPSEAARNGNSLLHTIGAADEIAEPQRPGLRISSRRPVSKAVITYRRRARLCAVWSSPDRSSEDSDGLRAVTATAMNRGGGPGSPLCRPPHRLVLGRPRRCCQ